MALKAGHDEKISVANKELAKKLTAVEDKLIQNKIESSQDAINYPRVFSNHIGRLYQVLVNAHNKPTGGVMERYEDLKKNFTGFKKELISILENDLPAFNALLAQEEVPRLIVPYK